MTRSADSSVSVSYSVAAIRSGSPAPRSSGSRQPHPIDREIRFGDIAYRYVVASGGWEALCYELGLLGADRFFVVADEGIPAEIVNKVVNTVGASAPTFVMSMTASEQTKRLGLIGDLADAILRSGVTRQSCIVAVGGGLVGNVSGLLASLIFRGIRLIHIPTTLLALSDSTLSLKQAVNGGVAKNAIGCYYAPELVWSDLEIIMTSPPDAARPAMCEAAKNVLAIVPERFNDFIRLARPEGNYVADEILWFIELCLTAKTRIMADDPRERGPGIVLEYGHTVGHAIELASDGQIPHGYAIGLGMLVAAESSAALGYLGRDDADKHWEILRRIGAPLRFPFSIDVDQLLQRVSGDNKRGYLKPCAGAVDMVLLRKLGEPVETDGLPLCRVPIATLRQSLEILCIPMAECSGYGIPTRGDD